MQEKQKENQRGPKPTHVQIAHRERDGEREKAMAGATTEKRRAAMQKAKAMPKQDKM